MVWDEQSGPAPPAKNGHGAAIIDTTSVDRARRPEDRTRQNRDGAKSRVVSLAHAKQHADPAWTEDEGGKLVRTTGGCNDQIQRDGCERPAEAA